MDTVAYPDEELAKYINETFIAVKVDVKKEEALARKFGVVWTPWLLLLDEGETRLGWTVGPFHPSDYRMWLEAAANAARTLADTLKMLPADPDNADMNSLIGRLYLARGDYAKAVNHLKVAVKGIGPDRAEVCNQACVALGCAAAHTGDEAAMKQATDCIQKCKGSEAAVALEKAHAKAFAGKWEDAAKEYQAVTDHFPKDPCAPEAWYWLGVASYHATGKGDGLLDAWKKLIADAPDSSWGERAQMTLSQ